MFLVLSLPNPLKLGFKNEDVVGAVSAGDAPTASECLTVLLATQNNFNPSMDK